MLKKNVLTHTESQDIGRKERLRFYKFNSRACTVHQKEGRAKIWDNNHWHNSTSSIDMDRFKPEDKNKRITWEHAMIDIARMKSKSAH